MTFPPTPLSFRAAESCAAHGGAFIIRGGELSFGFFLHRLRAAYHKGGEIPCVPRRWRCRSWGGCPARAGRVPRRMRSAVSARASAFQTTASRWDSSCDSTSPHVSKGGWETGTDRLAPQRQGRRRRRRLSVAWSLHGPRTSHFRGKMFSPPVLSGAALLATFRDCSGLITLSVWEIVLPSGSTLRPLGCIIRCVRAQVGDVSPFSRK